MQEVRLTGDTKLAISVNVSVNDCLSLCISPVMNCLPAQGAPHLLPYVI